MIVEYNIYWNSDRKRIDADWSFREHITTSGSLGDNYDAAVERMLEYAKRGGVVGEILVRSDVSSPKYFMGEKVIELDDIRGLVKRLNKRSKSNGIKFVSR